MDQENRTRIYPMDQEGRPMVSVFTRYGHQLDQLLDEKTIMGRMHGGEGVGLEIPSYLVSRTHGEFGVIGGRIFYRDLGSSNGTRVNGELCRDAVSLEADDILTISPRSADAVYADCAILVSRCPEGMQYRWSTIELNDEVAEITIGRETADDAMAEDSYLSRRHASFFRSSKGWIVLDLGSTNGVMVNREKIDGYHVLEPMDLVRIGSGCFLYLGDQLVTGWLTAQESLPVNAPEPAAEESIPESWSEQTEDEAPSEDAVPQMHNDHGYVRSIPQAHEGESLVIDIIEKNVWNRMKKKTLLRDVNMTIHPGEMVLILGGSGAGKTTFMNAVIGYESAEGSVRYGDLDVFREYDQIKYQIGYVPQQDLLRLQDSVYETLYAAAEMKLPNDCSKDDMRARTEWAIEMMGLAKETHTLVGKLSGGQRKRLSIAVELVGDPALLFLDEPDSGLDGIMARTLMENLRDIADMGKIVMVITHGPDRAAELFDEVMVLAKSTQDQCGHLAFYGDTKEAYRYFGVGSLEGIVRRINREDEGGEGLADHYIERWNKQ